MWIVWAVALLVFSWFIIACVRLITGYVSTSCWHNNILITNVNHKGYQLSRCLCFWKISISVACLEDLHQCCLSWRSPSVLLVVKDLHQCCLSSKISISAACLEDLRQCCLPSKISVSAACVDDLHQCCLSWGSPSVLLVLRISISAACLEDLHHCCLPSKISVSAACLEDLHQCCLSWRSPSVLLAFRLCAVSVSMNCLFAFYVDLEITVITITFDCTVLGGRGWEVKSHLQFFFHGTLDIYMYLDRGLCRVAVTDLGEFTPAITIRGRRLFGCVVDLHVQSVTSNVTQ